MDKHKQPEFLNDSASRAVKDALIPTAENEYLPKVLQTKPLSVIVVSLIMFKVFATLFLFFLYPDLGELSSDIYNRIIELTNQTRIEEGVAPLNTNTYLNQAAQAKAQDMFDRQYFAHDTPDGKKPWQWIDKSSYDYINAGENLAMNFTSADVAHLALLKSPTHKKNIVNPKYQDIGVAVLSGELNGKQTMVMVEMFGRQRSVSSVSPLISGVGGGSGEQPEEIGNKKLEIGDDDEPTPSLPKQVRDRLSQEGNTTKVAGVVKSPENTIPKAFINTEPKQIQELEPLAITDTGKVVSETKLADLKEKNLSTLIASIEPKVQEITVKPTVLRVKSTFARKVMKYSNYLLIFGLAFISLILILNIFIKIKVQHPVVIMQSLVAVIVIMGFLISKFHFAQELATKVTVG
jgi:uncharacterized protein YkwD